MKKIPLPIKRYLYLANSFVMLAGGFFLIMGYAIYPSIAGLLHTRTGSYGPMFYLIGACAGIAALAAWCMGRKSHNFPMEGERLSAAN